MIYDLRFWIYDLKSLLSDKIIKMNYRFIASFHFALNDRQFALEGRRLGRLRHPQPPPPLCYLETNCHSERSDESHKF